jgi:O-antigen/teichoic acid export membrane protein
VSAGRILVNTSWILGEKVLRLFAGVLVGLWVARYLGPERFGILSFGIAWVALFGTLATLGLPQVVSRDLVSFPDQAREILATAGALRMVGGILAMAVSVASFGLVYGFSDHRLVVVLCAAVATPFHTADVVEYWFRSRVEWPLRLSSSCCLTRCIQPSAHSIHPLRTGFGVVRRGPRRRSSCRIRSPAVAMETPRGAHLFLGFLDSPGASHSGR